MAYLICIIIILVFVGLMQAYFISDLRTRNNRQADTIVEYADLINQLRGNGKDLPQPSDYTKIAPPLEEDLP